MLSELFELRGSVGKLAPLVHPSVRNLANKDRLVIYLNEHGIASAASMKGVDARTRVQISKDNHHSFPACNSDRDISSLKEYGRELA